MAIWCEIISVWDAHSEDAHLRIFNVTYMEVFSKASWRRQGYADYKLADGQRNLI